MKKQLIEAAIKYIYQLDDFEYEDVYAQVEKELNEVLDLNQSYIVKQRLRYIKIGREKDYLQRLIETSEGHVLAGIRHLGGDLNEPFVFIWPSFQIQNMEQIIKELYPYFVMFKPKAYHFWIRPDKNIYNFEVLQQRFVAKVEDVKKDEFKLDRAFQYYDWYEHEYEVFHKEYPEFKYRIPVNGKDTMEHAYKDNLLYFLNNEEEHIGLVAGEYEKFLNKKSVYIDELLISSKYRGQGYGPKLLGSFVNALDVSYIHCHIDIKNIASTKTALRAGEKIFSQECRVKIITK